MMMVFLATAATDAGGAAHGDNTIPLIGLVVALLGTLVGTVWKFSSTVTRFDLAIKHLKRGDRKLARKVSVIPAHDRRIERLEEKLGLLRGGSRPDTDHESEEDDDGDDDDEDEADSE